MTRLGTGVVPTGFQVVETPAVLPGWLVYVAAVVGVAGIVPYVRDTLRGRTFPHRVTWSLWAFIPLVTLAVQFDEHVGIQKVVTASYVIVPATVVIASFAARRGSFAVTAFDWACAAMSVAALAVFALTSSGDVTIAMLVVADACAGVPTVRKSYGAPESETWTAFVAGVAASALTLATITRWTFPTYALPAYIGLQSLVEVVLIFSRIGPRRRLAAGRRRHAPPRTP